jgi:hypothetical protein
MSPVVHGRIYPETESSALMGYMLRVLVDPRILREHARAMLDIDTLRVYLRTIESPCRIVLLLPAARDDPDMHATYEFMRKIEAEELPSSVVIAPEAAAAFPEASADAQALALASTAWFADADIVISEQMATHADVVARFNKLHMELVDIQGAKRACEVFVRGHEVPWSFRFPAWLTPWTPFYAMVDADIQTMEAFRGLAARKGVSPEGQERIRSLALNRWSAIAYTRDKLFFFMIQRRRAKRHKLEKQEFTFELAYHLTVYFLLFWGALDQISWIVNDLYGLGFAAKQWWKVGVGKKGFLDRLRESDAAMMAIFQEPEFLRWIDVLRRARHYVAHKGIAMLSPLIEKPAREPSLAEVDQDIERWEEWRELASRWPAAMMETFRPNFRAKWYMRNYRQISDAAFVIQDATDMAIIFPLQNIEWEYERFRAFTLAVAARCSKILNGRPDLQ